VSAEGVHDIAITGGGTFDGQGLEWWRNRDDFRPHMVQFNHVTTALLTDTLYKDAPSHVLELYCDFCELSGVRVLAPPSTGDCEKDETCSHNTDAVDVHGEPFYIHDVNFTTGDDNVAAHANGTLVEDSFFGTGHGASIGSLCGSWLHNITFRNITFEGTTCGARIKSRTDCAGHVWDVTYENLTMRSVGQAIDLTQFYTSDAADGASSPYLFDHIVFRDIQVEAPARRGGAEAAGGHGEDPTVAFDCGTHHNKANCNVTMEQVEFVGYDDDATMECKGTVGAATHVSGIKSCLKD
jgi:polygalacturonase